MRLWITNTANAQPGTFAEGDALVFATLWPQIACALQSIGAGAGAVFEAHHRVKGQN
jgi:hypothetical protein